jgi:hypothetical protein
VVLAALGAPALAGCDSGPPVSQTRPVDGYSQLEVEGELDLEVRLFNRPEPGVRITAGDKAIDRIRTEVIDDTLRISTKSRGLTIGPDPLGDVSVSLGVSALTGLRVDGSADVLLSGLSATWPPGRRSSASTARGIPSCGWPTRSNWSWRAAATSSTTADRRSPRVSRARATCASSTADRPRRPRPGGWPGRGGVS